MSIISQDHDEVSLDAFLDSGAKAPIYFKVNFDLCGQHFLYMDGTIDGVNTGCTITGITVRPS